MKRTKRLDLNKKRREKQFKDVILTIALGIIVAGGSLSLNSLINPKVTEAETITPSFEYKEELHIDASISLKIESKCNLSFYSYKTGSLVQTPEIYAQRLVKFDCSDKQVLTRIAYYESEWGKYTVNPINPYVHGIYQVLDTTIDFCHDNGVDGLENCVLYVYRNYRDWFESATTYNF